MIKQQKQKKRAWVKMKPGKRGKGFFVATKIPGCKVNHILTALSFGVFELWSPETYNASES